MMKNDNEEVMKPVVLSILIPVFNNLGYTKKCIQNLKQQVGEIENQTTYTVVIDDGSTDGTSAWIKENHPDVLVLKGNGDLWWSGGINRGVSFALYDLKTDYILWWNNDILARDDYFKNLFAILRSNPDSTILGSKIFVLNKDVLWGMGGKFDAEKGTRFMYGEQSQDKEEFDQPFEVDWFPGMGTVIHRKVFETTGYLDEKNFPQYHGDSDFTFRAKKAGFKLIAHPALVLYNDNSNTGLKHKGSLSNLFRSLTSIKSNYNIKKDVRFFSIHAKSPIAYRILFQKYFRYIGGFFKWKLLHTFGVRKKITI
jgi:GT2 family glycosyltransferase